MLVNYMKQKVGHMICGQVELFIKLLIAENDYKKIIVVAPGSKWSKFVESLNPIIIYDRDYHLPYEEKDVIFEDCNMDADVIITFHGEKMYPINKRYEGNHVIILDKKEHPANCTQKIDNMKCEEFQGHLVYYA